MTDRESPPLIATLAHLRADIALTRHVAYFQTGTHGPVPDSTQRFVAEMTRQENLWVLAASGHAPEMEYCRREADARRVLADFLAVGEDELAWTYSTSSGTRLAARSLDWRPGDMLAVSDVEHKSTDELVRALKSLVGVVTTIIPTGENGTFSPAYFLEQLDRRLTPDHRLLIVSHVANTDGRRLPVKEAVHLARRRGVLTLADGAQAVGVFPIDVGGIDADFYSGSLHKWLLGPAGVGFLVVRRQQLPHYNPIWRPVVYENGFGTRITEPNAGRMSEIGTPNITQRLATAYNVEMFQRIGMNTIEDQVRRLSFRLRDGIAQIRGARVAGPHAWELSSGLTGIQFPGRSPDQILDLVHRMREEYAICVKYRPEIEAIRVAVAPFNIAEEIDRLLETLARLAPAK